MRGEEGKTLKSLGEDLRVSKERIRQIEIRAFSKLREALSGSSELADLLPDNVVESLELARACIKNQQAMTLRASVLLASPLRSGGHVPLAKLIDWVDSLPDSDECVELLIPELQNLEDRGAIVTTHTDSGLMYALAPSALAHLQSLSRRLSQRNVQSILEYLEALPSCSSVSGGSAS